MKMTFGRARLANELAGITMDVVNKQHQEKVTSGVWNWTHANAASRHVEGQRSVPMALTISKPLEKLDISVDDFLPEGNYDPALGPTRMGREITKVLKGREKCCQWRHQENGVQLVCSNSWISPEIPTCPYHVKYCMLDDGQNNHQQGVRGMGRRVVLPNKDGLCERHYLAKYHQLPPNLRAGVPGVMQQSSHRMAEVARVTNGLKEKPKLNPNVQSKTMNKGRGKNKRRRKRRETGQSKEGEEAGEEQHRENKEIGRPTCSWNASNDQGWRFQCENICTTQKKTGAVMPVCAWHLKHCRVDNPWVPVCNQIHVPNHLGLCRNHYVAGTSGTEPEQVDLFSVPGAICLHKFNPPPHLPDLHSFAPRTEPQVSNERLQILADIFSPSVDPTGCDSCMDCVDCCVAPFQLNQYMWYKRRYRMHEYVIFIVFFSSSLVQYCVVQNVPGTVEYSSSKY